MKRQKFFALHADCFLVKGSARGAIYNLCSSQIFGINGRSYESLEQLERGMSVRDVCATLKIPQYGLKSFLDDLIIKGVGSFVGEDHDRQKIRAPEKTEGLVFAHLELTAGCNFKCVHCYNEAACDTAKKDELVFEDWARVMREIHRLGCKRIQFVGGEPFIRRKMLFNLVREARRIGFDMIEIFSNCYLITNNDLMQLKKLGVSMASSFYSVDEKVHDAITQRKGSHKKALGNFRKIVDAEIPLRIGLIVSRLNEASVEVTQDFLKETYGINNVKIDFVRPSGRGCESNLVTKSMVEKQIVRKPQFSGVNAEQFFAAKTGHNCFSDKICISPQGDVHPCVMEREFSYGNAQTDRLSNIFSGVTARNFKEMTRDNIHVCKDCEYRYACFDCRIKARNGQSTDLRVKPWWCTYDPYTGEWGAVKKEDAL